MKTFLLQTVLVWHLMGIITGESQNSILKRSTAKLTSALLSMSKDSFDDQYENCDSEMEKELMCPTQTEFGSTPDYAETWRLASQKWKSLSNKSLKSEYGTAVVAYTNGSSTLYKDFNKAVREYTPSTDFAFKSFHFLLTKALQSLKNSQNGCYTTYRGVGNINFISSQGQTVRFGQFASSSENQNVAREFLGRQGTFFTIETCFGVRIEQFSYKPKQKEVLIPPYEMFTVSERNVDGDIMYINLESTGKVSTYNCGALKAAGPMQLSANILVLSFLSGILLVSGTLGSPDIF